jgi:hypothetical protein
MPQKSCIKQLAPQHKPVDHNWADHFLNCHEKILSTHWSSPLDQNHADASPNAIAGFYHVYGEIMTKFNIPATNQFGADESGIQLSVGCTKHIIGLCGKHTTYNCCGGDQELITSCLSFVQMGLLQVILLYFQVKDYLIDVV